MALRIDRWVLRGELDNREKGRVTGRLWLHGAGEPVVLELTGNACGDLAGCLLTFTRQAGVGASAPDKAFDARQEGAAGDLSASRKVRVFDVPGGEAPSQPDGVLAPARWANALYLEWYSRTNGRVVLESADFDLAVTPPSWRPTEQDEEERRRASASGFESHIRQLDRAIEARRFQAPEDRDLDEFEWEKLLRESDARGEKYAELLEKYMDDPDRDIRVAREMGWDRLADDLESSRNEPPVDGGTWNDEDDDEDDGEFDLDPRLLEQFEEEEREDPDPATEGIDWVRTEDGEIEHPLVRRVMDGAIDLMKRVEERGDNPDADLEALVSAYTILGPKLGGALTSFAQGDLYDPAMTIALLKRAMVFLHEAQAALVRLEGRDGILPPDEHDAMKKELFTIRQAMLDTMTRLRGKAF